MTQQSTRIVLNAACTAALLGLPTIGSASGFAVPEISITGLGLNNAAVANTDEIGAIVYNPANAVFHDGITFSGGLMLVRPDLAVTTASGQHDSSGKENVLIPMFQATYQVNDKITLGLGANAPFGLETRWPEGTFPVLEAADPDGAGPAQAGALQPTTSRLETIVISPTISMRLHKNAAVSAGLDYYRVNEVVFDAADATNEGSGDGWGWNLSGVYIAGPLTFGVNYHSKATVDVSGESTLTIAGPTTLTAPATADVPMPWRLQAGVNYRANKDLSVEANITRTGWSAFDVLTIQGVSETTSTNNWKDANAYRIGATYRLSNRTRLRAGYSYDETGQQDKYYSARIPDADRHLFSLGFGHDVSKDLGIDAGYMYVRFKDRNIASTVPFGTYGADPNGTSAYNGDYKASVHIVGVGMTKRF